MRSPQPTRLIESGTLFRDFPPSRRYLIGVSGGRDSIALLHLLVDLGYNKLVVCHLNHQLRGRESRRDARFVEKIARGLQLGCEIGSTDVGALAKQSILSIEKAARFGRFAFFVVAARRHGCSRIFLAHHADDLVVTALLNLFRGARPRGIAEQDWRDATPNNPALAAHAERCGCQFRYRGKRSLAHRARNKGSKS